MKKNTYLLLLALVCTFVAPAQKIKKLLNLEFEVGVSSNLPQKRSMSTVLTYTNSSESYKTDNPITFGYYANISYHKKLGLGFSLIPGISFMSFNKESKTVVEYYTTAGTSYYKENRHIKNKYDNLAASLGLRWAFSKISLEAGIGFMAVLKQDKTTTVDYPSGGAPSVVLENNNVNRVIGFGYSYYQFGFKILPHIWLNAGVRAIINGNDLMNNDYNAYYDKSQLATRELMPMLGIKIKLL